MGALFCSMASKESPLFKSTSNLLLVNLECSDLVDRNALHYGVSRLSHYENIFINIETISQGVGRISEIHTFDVIAAICHSNLGHYWASVRQNNVWCTGDDMNVTSSRFTQPQNVKCLLLKRKQIDKINR